MGNLIDLTGQRFGRLVVIKRGKNTSQGSATWLCQCDCGNKKVFDGGGLRRGKTTSCGCRKIKNLIGRRFGRLTVTSFIEVNESHNVVWKCQCDCGNTTHASSKHLRDGDKKSCGCLRGKDLSKANKSLKENYLKDKTNLALLTSKIGKNNSSGTKGVCFIKRDKKWEASLIIQGKQVLRRCFSSKRDAINARKEAEQKYFNPILEKYGRKKLD